MRKDAIISHYVRGRAGQSSSPSKNTNTYTCNIVTEGMVLSIHNVHCLLEKELGGAEGKVAYIGMFPPRLRLGHHSELADRVNTSDTEGTFRPERYNRLSNGRDLRTDRA